MEMQEFVIDRSRYDEAVVLENKYIAKPGLSEELVRFISNSKNEPEWMLQKRLQGFEWFKKTSIPKWGPDLSKLDLDKISYYVDPGVKESKRWEDLPEEVRRVAEKIGIPEAEKKSLGGAGFQFDSNMAYHNLKKELEDQGVIFENMDVALQKYPELVKKYFMNKCIPVNDHKFIMLHAAVWSGGTFIYIPPGVKVSIPLQAYFRMNAQQGGQFEHTLIVADKNAEVQYVEGCFTEGNLIYTNPDYKPIKEIIPGQNVLTHDGTYKKVKEIYRRPYSGSLKKIRIYGNSVDTLEVTEDHPFLYVDRLKKNDRNKTWNIRWNLPKFFKRRDYLVIPINKTVVSEDYHEVEIQKWIGRKQGYKFVKKRIPSTKEFFKLAGYYIAEGSISGGHYLTFAFGNKERDLIDDVKSLLKSVFGIKKTIETHHKKNNGTNVVVCSTELCRIFEVFGKKANLKNIPQWMMLEDPDKQKHLIASYFKGDGNYYKQRHKSGFKEAFRINTVSEKLVRQCRDILLRLGIPAFINARNRKKENRQTMYTLGVSGEHMIKFGDIIGIKINPKINDHNRASMFGIDENFAFYPIREISSREVNDELVYNIAVEDNETYCVDGYTVHNCSSPLYSSSSNLHAGCVEIFVHENARVRYSSVENWSKNTYNLNTKRAIVEKNGIVEWINGNNGCLTGNSKVFTNPKGPKNIKDINKGDKVYVWDKKTNKIKKAIVKNKIFSGYKKVYKLIAGERIIEASANHPFLVLDKNKTFWVPLEKINKGAHIAVINSNSKNFIDWNILDGIKFTKVTSIIPLGIKPTFDIEVENFHNFIANGLIVHNSKTTMLYPCSVLIGEGAKSDSLGIAFAGPGQNQDTGSKVIHAAPNTTSTIKAKSISKGGGISSYRGSVQVTKNAKNTKCSVVCDALLIDDESVSNTFPFMRIDTNKVDIAHEASVGKIGEEQIFYLMSRGLTEEQAMQMVVSGFIEPIVKQLPLEYAVELNKLIELEMEGTVG